MGFSNPGVRRFSNQPLVTRQALDLEALLRIIQEHQDALAEMEASHMQLETTLKEVLARAKSSLVPAIHSDLKPKDSEVPERNPALSKRELQVVGLMVEGKTSKQIASELGISFKTAVTHRANIMSKMNVHETASVVREAIRRGWA